MIDKIPPGYYSLSFVSTSFNQLLYRMIAEGQNHDLLFINVTDIHLPFRFNLEAIELAEEDTIIIIHDEGRRSCINARRLHYQTNDYPPTESSIPTHREEPLTDQDILALVERVSSATQAEIQGMLNPGDWTIIKGFNL